MMVFILSASSHPLIFELFFIVLDNYNAFEVDCEHEKWFPVQPVGGIKKITDCVNNP